MTQDEQPDQQLTTVDYVALGCILHHGRHDRATQRRVVAKTLEATGIGALADRELGALSGGEQQRARISWAALAQSPCILLLSPSPDGASHPAGLCCTGPSVTAAATRTARRERLRHVAEDQDGTAQIGRQ